MTKQDKLKGLIESRNILEDMIERSGIADREQIRRLELFYQSASKDIVDLEYEMGENKIKSGGAK